MKPIPSSEITPEHLYRSRRRFLKSALLVAGGAALAACAPRKITNLLTATPPTSTSLPLTPDAAQPTTSALIDELGDPLTSFEAVTNYNNYYEFSFAKEAVAKLSAGLVTSPWEITVSGLVNNPKTYNPDDLRQSFGEEERIYRMRCVEGWSMVIPWQGFPLKKLLDEVQPTSDAKYVRFETLFDPNQLPNQNDPFFPWPYVEGLRLDEAYNDLTLISTGLYGKNLLPQNGAPARLVVPWKYGFKSIKSITKISLVDSMPTSLWMAAASNEYGFYANVNPNVSHPRWSQASERRIEVNSRRDTLLFNGYEDQVAVLYKDMDLKANF
jgi:methionine sulfoxide reductase catalytic subunit